MTQIASWDNPELNLELFFCTEVLGLNSLHYGYWEQEESIDLKSIHRAQQRYTESLLKMIPEDVHNILDIGCGIGDNAKALAANGYEVTCISPDHIHASYFKDADQSKIHFINTGIENFSSEQKYDMVLMSESQGYFAMDMGFSQSVHHLRPGGYLLVSGIFKKDNASGFHGSHPENQYIKCAEDFNLVKKGYVDITDNILPTLKFAFDNYNNYLNPLIETTQYFIGKSGQVKIKLLKKLFAREFQNFEVVRDYYEERFNPVLFRENMCYSRILFQFQPNIYEKKLVSSSAQKPLVSAIICAFNEEKTLKDNLAVMAACEHVDEVIVVNDGSTDQTGDILQTFVDGGKIKAIHFEHNQGKSCAMITAALRAFGDVLVFLDADLQNLNSAHIQTLIQPLLEHKVDMVIGEPRNKSDFMKSIDPFRSLSGERSVWREDLLPLVEQIRDSGYGIESLLNLAYKENNKNICYRNLDGLNHPWKLEKANPFTAAIQYTREGIQIMQALISRINKKESSLK